MGFMGAPLLVFLAGVKGHGGALVAHGLLIGFWLLRGLARSHRDCARPANAAVPVGAGKPAKKPAPIQQASMTAIYHPGAMISQFSIYYSHY
jgi:hypothetical protein